MQRVVLTGRRKAEIREFPVSEPGHGQVLILMKASFPCGSDSQTSYTAALTIFEVAHE